MEKLQTCNYLKKARSESGLTREQLSERLGVSPTTLLRWENGTSKIFFDDLVNLAEALNKPLSFFTGDISVPSVNKKVAQVIDEMKDQLGKIQNSLTPNQKVYSWNGYTYDLSDIEKLKILDRKLSMVQTCKEARKIFASDEEAKWWTNSFWAIDSDWCEARVLLFFKRFHPRTNPDNARPFSLSLDEAPGWFRLKFSNYEELTCPPRHDKTLQDKALA